MIGFEQNRSSRSAAPSLAEPMEPAILNAISAGIHFVERAIIKGGFYIRSSGYPAITPFCYLFLDAFIRPRECIRFGTDAADNLVDELVGGRTLFIYMGLDTSPRHGRT